MDGRLFAISLSAFALVYLLSKKVCGKRLRWKKLEIDWTEFKYFIYG